MTTKTLFLFALLLPSLLWGQTISNNTAISVPCCNYADSIDYDLDGVFDIQLYSSTGIDNANFSSLALRTGITTTSVVDSNAAFGLYNVYSGIAGTTMVCWGWYSWVPGTGGWRYIGFRDAVSPTDTIYGWIKVAFRGMQDSCDDTLLTEVVVYNTTPNEPLLAGEVILPTSTVQLPTSTAIQVFPNPARGLLHVRNAQEVDWQLCLYNAAGQAVLDPRRLLPLETQSLDLQGLPGGIYYLKGKNARQQVVEKVVID